MLSTLRSTRAKLIYAAIALVVFAPWPLFSNNLLPGFLQMPLILALLSAWAAPGLSNGLRARLGARLRNPRGALLAFGAAALVGLVLTPPAILSTALLALTLANPRKVVARIERHTPLRLPA